MDGWGVMVEVRVLVRNIFRASGGADGFHQGDGSGEWGMSQSRSILKVEPMEFLVWLDVECVTEKG